MASDSKTMQMSRVVFKWQVNMVSGRKIFISCAKIYGDREIWEFAEEASGRIFDK